MKAMKLKISAYIRLIPAFTFISFLIALALLKKRGAYGDNPLDSKLTRGASSAIYATTPAHLAVHFPSPDAERKDYREWNAQTMRELHMCLAQNSCGKNQAKIALLAAHWFEEAVVRGWRGGEGVWGLSVYKNLKAMGYTTLFANSFEEALYQYRLFPDLVKVVIRNKAGECHSDPKCVKGPTNPSGIPAWKIFDFEFFPSHGGHFHASLMKGKWILAANPDRHFDNDDDSPIQYIGYSIEEDCRKIPRVPFSGRRSQAWMLMKQLKYVYDKIFAWDRSYFAKAAEELDMDFVGGWQVDQHYGGWKPETQGLMMDIENRAQRIINHGRLNQSDFAREVGRSKVMIGVGAPWWSPSPYNALCQGVPFINPVLHWNKDSPRDKKSWYTQHPSLDRYDPPFVYHVQAKDWKGFVDAVREASLTEIPSFIPEHMTESAVQMRLEKLMETDWRAQAAKLLENRISKAKSIEGAKPYIFEL